MPFLTSILTKAKSKASSLGEVSAILADPFSGGRGLEDAFNFMVNRIINYKIPKWDKVKWYLQNDSSYRSSLKRGIGAYLLGAFASELEGKKGLPIIGPVGDALAKFGIGTLTGLGGSIILWHPNHPSSPSSGSNNFNGNLY